jgi:cytoplasmic protein
MLSYRHAFHAGNHADLLKHYLLTRTLAYYAQKAKAFDYIDTHAGAGYYDLTAAYAQKNCEYQSGIARLDAAPDLPAPLAAWRAQMRELQPAPDTYPGSAWIAARLLPPSSKLHLFELHPTDHAALAQNLRPLRLGRRLRLQQADGFAGLISLLPPTSRRAVILIDPPYEQKYGYKNEYEMVLDTLSAAQSRFASGSYLIWYPCLPRGDGSQFAMQLTARFGYNFLRAELHVRAASGTYGMYGSGMFIINPPYTLPGELQTVLPALQALCAEDSGSKFILKSRIP